MDRVYSPTHKTGWSRPRALGLALLVVTGGCGGSARDHELRGDRAYVDGEFVDALVEYRLALNLAAPNAGVRAKAGLAAFHAGDLVAAAEEFQAMALETDDRTTEAADGLEMVARAAVEDGDRLALESALAGLRTVAEGRAIGSFAQELARGLGDGPSSEDALSVLLYAAAGAPDAGLQDSLMFVYGSVLRRLGRCGPAAAVFGSLARRHRQPRFSADARRHGSYCAERMGRSHLARSAPDSAEVWFQRATQIGGDGVYGRAGWIGLGDLRLAENEILEARAAYERARRGLTVRDSIYRVASQRINALGDAATLFPREGGN